MKNSFQASIHNEKKKSIAIFSMHPVPYASPLYNELYKIQKKILFSI